MITTLSNLIEGIVVKRKYWQVAAGSFGRNYADKFLQFGVAFVGGESCVKTMDTVTPGDVILLKNGLL